jgi:hypothetical protein
MALEIKTLEEFTSALADGTLIVMEKDSLNFLYKTIEDQKDDIDALELRISRLMADI